MQQQNINPTFINSKNVDGGESLGCLDGNLKQKQLTKQKTPCTIKRGSRKERDEEKASVS